MNRSFLLRVSAVIAGVGLLGGCAAKPRRVTAPGGIEYQEASPLQRVWLAQDFNFYPYTVLYIPPPTLSGEPAKPGAKPRPSFNQLQQTFASAIRNAQLFPLVVTNLNDVPTGAKVLQFDNLLVNYTATQAGHTRSGMRLQGRISDGDRPIFMFEAPWLGNPAVDSAAWQAHCNHLAKEVVAFLRPRTGTRPPVSNAGP